MQTAHDKATIISIAVIASLAAMLCHEGLGHGVTAWLRGAIPTDLTSNHLSTVKDDKWVEAAGTLVNLFTGGVALVLSLDRGVRTSFRYFLWLFAAFSLFSGAGYFLFSGILGLGDWQAVIQGSPHATALRIVMSVFGAALYLLAACVIAIAAKPFCADKSLVNRVWILPYLTACTFECIAGAFDPLGWKMMLLSTIPAAFGGSSGMLWADHFMPRAAAQPFVTIPRSPAWWIASIVLGISYVATFGRGLHFSH